MWANPQFRLHRRSAIRRNSARNFVLHSTFHVKHHFARFILRHRILTRHYNLLVIDRRVTHLRSSRQYHPSYVRGQHNNILGITLVATLDCACAYVCFMVFHSNRALLATYLIRIVKTLTFSFRSGL